MAEEKDKQQKGPKGGKPSAEEIAEEMQLSVARVRAALKMAQQPISLQSPTSGDSEDSSFGDFIEDKGTECPSETTSFTMLRDRLHEVLAGLRERERKVLEMRFGLGDGFSRTLEEVGRHFQVTRDFLTNRALYLHHLLDDHAADGRDE